MPVHISPDQQELPATCVGKILNDEQSAWALCAFCKIALGYSNSTDPTEALLARDAARGALSTFCRIRLSTPNATKPNRS